MREEDSSAEEAVRCLLCDSAYPVDQFLIDLTASEPHCEQKNTLSFKAFLKHDQRALKTNQTTGLCDATQCFSFIPAAICRCLKSFNV